MTSTLFQTALSLFGLQLFSRLSTFILNQAIIRLISPHALGTLTIQFDVLINTALFFSRESVRLCLARTPQHLDPSKNEGTHPHKDLAKLNKKRTHERINLCFLSVPIGLLVSTSLFTIYYRTVQRESIERSEYFTTSLAIYLLSCWIELLSEPSYLYLSFLGQKLDERIKVEGISVAVKAILNFLIILFFQAGSSTSTAKNALGSARNDSLSLLAFSLGQLGFSLSLCIGLWYKVLMLPRHPSSCRLFPCRSEPQSQRFFEIKSWIGNTDFTLCLALFRQSIVKQFLSEGDKMLVGKICPVSQQGGYALAMNYGSLMARIVFQPVEETSRLYFSKNLPLSLVGSSKSEKHENGVLRTSICLLFNLIKSYLYMGLIFLSFGPPYVQLALSIVLGRRSDYLLEGTQSSVVKVLKAYCNLLPLLGVNGILEGFSQSVSNQAQLDQISKLMVLWCLAFLTAVKVFSSKWCSDRLGIAPEVAIVLATQVNMICRIAYNYHFVKKFISNHGDKGLTIKLGDFLPSYFTLAGFLISGGLARWSEHHFMLDIHYQCTNQASFVSHLLCPRVLCHLLIGMSSLMGCMAIVWLKERDSIQAIIHLRKLKTA